jgi:peptidyl-Lys metalloendopeptidase
MPDISSPKLLINLEFSQRSYKAADKHLLSFSLKNETDKTIRVLKWHTPFDGFKANMFDVTVSGKRTVYLGRLYKRGVPAESDYLTLEPGETKSVKLDLAEGYDIADAGDYSVSFRPTMLHAGTESVDAQIRHYVASGGVPQVPVKANVALFKLDSARPARVLEGSLLKFMKEAKEKQPSKKVPSFEGCTEAQKHVATAALAQAVTFAQESKSALGGAPVWARATARRYKEWFGTYTSSRYDKVFSHFDKIGDALANKSITFICDSTDSAYAYVYPTDPFKIYLCKQFWLAPLKGTDSQGGTLIHETSHFNVVAGTDDHVYGQSGCRAKAISNPDDAVDNADSYEYFAENTPLLSMECVPGSAFNTGQKWPGLPAGFTGNFDAALNGGGPFAGKCYFFKGDSYIRFDWSADKGDSGYPKKIADGWHNLPAGFRDNFDDAINGQGQFAGKCYFFKGDTYIRYDWSADKMDEGYPKKTADNWHDLPAGFREKFDAIINGGGPFAGKCYFFKGDSYVRYDWHTDKMDSGYPKKIADNWHCLPAGFTNSFNAGLEGGQQFGGNGYFFKGDLYIRYNWAEDHAS